jgi:hypothetical protein
MGSSSSKTAQPMGWPSALMKLWKLELAERFLEEAKGFMEKEDPVQASEKLYKVAEECVEIPAEALRRARAS